MSRHNRQRNRRYRRSLEALDGARLVLIQWRLDNTGRFPSYATAAERRAFLEQPSLMQQRAATHRYP